MLKKDLQPTKVIKLHCPKCGELMVKIYPWSSIRPIEGKETPNCRKCIAKWEEERERVVKARQIAASKGKIPFVR